ncbi:hypothetical protein ACOQFS_17600 [Paracidovorax sp. MALMAid1276]
MSFHSTLLGPAFITLEPFTLSLSKRGAGLRQAQPERVSGVQAVRCRSLGSFGYQGRG